MKRALIFGASGQMGYYLVQFLKTKDYVVYCPRRRDLDFASLSNWDLRTVLESEQPDEIYNLAGVNYAPDSWHMPGKYMQINGYAVMQLLNMIASVAPKTKFFQAGSAEVFEPLSVMQCEDTNRLPENPYGLSKMMALELVRIFRQKYGMFACTGILFNAESPRRAQTFFAEKVVAEVVKLKRDLDSGKWTPIRLGRLDARRDWGWAPEYVEVMWKMLQLEEPMDFVIGTGETHTCWTYVMEALKAVGIPKAEEPKVFETYVKYDRTEAPPNTCMRAQPHKAKRFLGWEAQYKMTDVIRMLVEAELKS